MTTLKNDSKTCQISRNTTKDGTSWELLVFKTGTPKRDLWKRSSIHAFGSSVTLVDFITLNKFA